MNRDEVFDKLNGIFRQVFDDDEIIVTDDTTANDIEDWDSFEHINLVTAIEASFKVKFTMDEVMEMKKVGDMADAIQEKTRK